jgi:hypothetical protein
MWTEVGCLFIVSHVSSGEQATSQKEGRQEKTHFHNIFEFDFDFGWNWKLDKLSLTCSALRLFVGFFCKF